MSSKTKNKKKNNEPKVIKTGEDVFMISSLGIKIQLRAVSPYLIDNVEMKVNEDFIDGYTDANGNEHEGHGSLPEIPSYEYTPKGADKPIQIQHDLTTLDDTDDEEEKKENWRIWNQYQADLDEFNALHATRVSRVILHKGVVVEYPPKDDEWAKVQELLNANIPEDEPARRLHYVETEVLGSRDDIEMIVSEVMALVGVDREEVERIKADNFQGEVSRPTVSKSDDKAEKSVDGGEHV